MEVQKINLTEVQRSEISGKFQVLDEEKKAIVSQYNDIITQELTPALSIKAKALDAKMQKHLKAKKDIHTANKAYFLNGGRFVDSIYKVEEVEFGVMRDKTQEIKNYAEELKKKKLESLQFERVILLSEFIDAAEDKNLSSMDQDVWESYLATKKQAYIDAVAAEAQAEKERAAQEIADKEEQERIRKENQRLRAEALKREEQAKIEADKLKKIEADRLAKENAERLQREAAAAKERAEYEAKLRNEREAKERIEREERVKREKLEAQIQAQKDADLQVQEDAEAKIQAELNKGDEAKMDDLVEFLEALKGKYTFDSVKNKKIYDDVKVLLGKIQSHIILKS
jgi:hypothetical protein